MKNNLYGDIVSSRLNLLRGIAASYPREQSQSKTEEGGILGPVPILGTTKESSFSEIAARTLVGKRSVSWAFAGS